MQELPGHMNVETTVIDTHVVDKGPGSVRSPLDREPRSFAGQAITDTGPAVSGVRGRESLVERRLCPTVRRAMYVGVLG